MSIEDTSLPRTGLQIRSTVAPDGKTLGLSLERVEVPLPEPGQVVVRVEAAPVNPSDVMPMLAGADPAAASFETLDGLPRLAVPIAPGAGAGREGFPLPIGLGGAGTVVAAGLGAEPLEGARVTFLTMGMGSFAQYCTMAASECLVLPETVEPHQAADLFCNPMTALAIVETLHQTGETALVHTAAASNLGQMLVRLCQEDGIGLVNVVRREEQAQLLRSLGAEHVVVSGTEGFAEALVEAIVATGARSAFDAVGGGPLAGDLLRAMEAAAVHRMGGFAPFGTSEMKRVYQYGHLDPSAPDLAGGGFGMIWGLEGWAMPPILERAGAERSGALAQRALSDIKTTFASTYARTIGLADLIDREALEMSCRQATGGKLLLDPRL